MAANIESLKKQFGERVARLRKLRNMRQEELAASIGYNRTSITNLEAGRQNITLETAFLLSKCLNVQIVELFPIEAYESLDVAAEVEIKILRRKVHELEQTMGEIRRLVN